MAETKEDTVRAAEAAQLAARDRLGDGVFREHVTFMEVMGLAREYGEACVALDRARLLAASAPLTITGEQDRVARDTDERLQTVGVVGGREKPVTVTWRDLLAEIDALRVQVAVLRKQAPAALDFDVFQQLSIARCESPDNGFNQKLDEWTILEWAGAMCGEAGEASNVAKKMRRKRIQRGDDKATVELLGEELADTVGYAALTAARAGIDLGEAVVAKFNKVSKEIGSTLRLAGKKAA